MSSFAQPGRGPGALVFALSDACLAVAKGAIAAMTLLIVADVLLRFALRAPIPGAYELVGYLGALAVAGALPHIQRSAGFIVVETLTQSARGAARRWLRRLSLAVETAFFAVLTFQFALGTAAMRASHQVSDILHLPLWGIYALVSVGLFGVSAVALCQLLAPAPEGEAHVA